jgi:hypothetical protein
MVQNLPSPPSSLFPPQPFPEGAEAFSRQIHSPLDGHRAATAAWTTEAVRDLFCPGLGSLASQLFHASAAR